MVMGGVKNANPSEAVQNARGDVDRLGYPRYKRSGRGGSLKLATMRGSSRSVVITRSRGWCTPIGNCAGDVVRI